MTDAYRSFLEEKATVAPALGLDVPFADINPQLKPHAQAIARWAVQGGRRAIFASFGLAKTSMQLEIVRHVKRLAGGEGLIVLPLGVRQEFANDAATLFAGKHAVRVKFIRRAEEIDGSDQIYLTNYETIRDGKLDPRLFKVASLDEASVLRGFGGSKTFREFMRLFDDVPYRFVATATPDPNEYIELLSYAAFLGVMDVGQAKPPHSWHPDVWTDIARMRTLNMVQAQKGKEMHLCLARGSRVLTRDGYKPIETMMPGDMVLTHKGRWRRVEVVRNTGVRPVVTVKAQGVPGLTLTPDHKLWTRKVRNIPWSKSHSKLEASRVEPGWVRADETFGSYLNLKLPAVEACDVPDDLLWIVGRWIADGHVHERGVMLSCAREEQAELETRLGDRAAAFRDTGTALQTRVKDAGGALREILSRCGKGAAGKCFPPEAFTMPPEKVRALLDGYLSGDGHFVVSRNRWTASTVSKDLALGLAMLVQRAYGAIASIYPGRKGGGAIIQGRTVATQPEWIVCFDAPRDADHWRPPMMLDDGAWKKVRSLEDAGEAETWCLRVEEDESFTAEGCVVKNCPLQFDIVDRAIEQMTEPGEVVFDPFAGLGTVPYCAVKLGRRGLGVELNPDYFADSVFHLRAAENGIAVPTLFDLDPPEEKAA